MPSGTPKYFSYPFGVNGDLAAIPDPTQAGGSISYQQGFGPDYALPSSNPAYLTIPRTNFNQLIYDITSTLQQLYQNGFPLFITSAMNDGAPFSYSKNAYVYQTTDGNVYYSLVNSNTDVPPTAKWQIVGGPTATSYSNFAADTGSANHYNIAPVPGVGTPTAGIIIILQPANANTGACDIIVNANTAVAIKTLQNQDPIAGMIIPSATHLLAFNAVTGFWVLLNPALGTAAYKNVGTSANNVLQLDGSAKIPAVDGSQILNILTAAFSSGAGKIVLNGGVTVQCGTRVVSGTTTVTFPTAFSGTPVVVAIPGGAYPPQTTTTVPSVTSVSSTGFTMNAFTSPGYWIAVGPT